MVLVLEIGYSEHSGQDIQCREILHYKERDTELKVPFAGFVPKDIHTRIDPDTPKGCGHKENESLRDTLHFPTFPGFSLITRHHEKGYQVDDP